MDSIWLVTHRSGGDQGISMHVDILFDTSFYEHVAQFYPPIFVDSPTSHECISRLRCQLAVGIQFVKVPMVHSQPLGQAHTHETFRASGNSWRAPQEALDPTEL